MLSNHDELTSAYRDRDRQTREAGDKVVIWNFGNRQLRYLLSEALGKLHRLTGHTNKL